jgi:hypothetical protein
MLNPKSLRLQSEQDDPPDHVRVFDTELERDGAAE